MAISRPTRRWSSPRSEGRGLELRARSPKRSPPSSPPSRTSQSPRSPGRASSTSSSSPQCTRRSDVVLEQGARFRRARVPARGQGQRRICLRQSDRADACRPRARRGVRRRAREPARLRRPRSDARILHQRRRRAGRRARPLGLSALPRGARRDDRRHPRGALSRRLSQAGRRGAGRASSARALRDKPEAEWLPIVRASARSRR